MFHRQPAAFYCICMGVGLLGVLSSMTPIVLDAEENFGLHLLYILRGPQEPPAGVVVVAIDLESAGVLDLPLAPNKWPRSLHSRLVARLTDDQAAVIAFDLFFHEPQGAGGDRSFAAAMRRAGNVVLTQAIDRQTLPLDGEPTVRVAHLNIERMVPVIPEFADAAVAQAPFPLPSVPVKLNQFWCFRSGSGNAPTLPVVAFHIYAAEAFAAFVHLLVEVEGSIAATLPLPDADGYDAATIVRLIRPLRACFEKDATLGDRLIQRLDGSASHRWPDRTVALMRSLIGLYQYGSSRYLNLYGPAGTLTTIPYHRLVADSLPGRGGDPPIIARSAVFVGQTASDWLKTHDSFYTVYSDKSGRDLSGVEIAATAFANLLEDKAVLPVQPSTGALLAIAWGVVIALIGMNFSTVLSVGGMLLLGGIYLTAAVSHFRIDGTWYPLFVPLLIQMPVALIAGLAWKHRRVVLERKNIREAFGHYLPDDVVDRLSANLKELRLGGEVSYGICLFTDAQNYTTVSETLAPNRLTELMNRYYEAVFKPIRDNGGVVLQVVGDSILAIWTAREPRRALRQAACRAAIDIAASVDRFNHQAGSHAMPTRIGIHAGEILLGNIGAMGHFEYRPVGDIVNTASRLEGLNKYLKTSILVSHAVVDPGDGITVRSVGHFVFKGKSQPVHVFELFPPGRRPPDQQATVQRLFAAGLEAFRQARWDEADMWFERTLQLDETDGPAQFYRARCRTYRQRAPEGAWDGAVHLEKK